jgi:hypothetical protein
MPQLHSNTAQLSNNVGAVIEFLLEVFSANKSVKHVEKVILTRPPGGAYHEYSNIFELVANTNYVFRVTNITRSNSTASVSFVDDIGGGFIKKSDNSNAIISGLQSGQSAEIFVAIAAAQDCNFKIDTTSIANATPVVTSQVDGANLNLLRVGSIQGSIPNSATFNGAPATNPYNNPYYIQSGFDWDWRTDGVVDGEVKIRFDFLNATPPVQKKIDSAPTFTTVNISGLYLAFPANTTTTIIFKNGDNVQVSKTFNVGALPTSVPAAPTVSVSAATTDDVIAISFATGTFTLEVVKGGIISQTVGSAVSPYSFTPPTVGNYVFRVSNSSGRSADSALVSVTQGENQTAPSSPTPNQLSGSIGNSISGTAAQNGTLIILLNGNQVATQTIVANAWSYTPNIAGMYTFRVSTSAGVSTQSSGVNVVAGGNTCNLSDEIEIAFWTTGQSRLLARTFNGGLTWQFVQEAEGKKKWFLTRGKEMLDRTDIEFRNNYTAGVKSCFDSPETSNAGLSLYEIDTPAGYERYNQTATTFAFKPINSKKANVKVVENTGNYAIELAWHTTSVFADIPESRFKLAQGVPPSAMFTDIPVTGTLYFFARNVANKQLVAQTQATI